MLLIVKLFPTVTVINWIPHDQTSCARILTMFRSNVSLNASVRGWVPANNINGVYIRQSDLINVYINWYFHSTSTSCITTEVLILDFFLAFVFLYKRTLLFCIHYKTNHVILQHIYVSRLWPKILWPLWPPPRVKELCCKLFSAIRLESMHTCCSGSGYIVLVLLELVWASANVGDFWDGFTLLFAVSLMAQVGQ